MPTTYTDLIADVRKRVKQVSLEELKRRLEAAEKMTLVDVREKDEWRAGYIPGVEASRYARRAVTSSGDGAMLAQPAAASATTMMIFIGLSPAR